MSIFVNCEIECSKSTNYAQFSTQVSAQNSQSTYILDYEYIHTKIISQ